MSILMFSVQAPVRLIAALQHLAAGIVLSAVAVELVPLISAAPTTAPNIGGIIVGFFVGIGLFLLLGAFCEVDADDDDELESSADSSPQKVTAPETAVAVNQTKDTYQLASKYPELNSDKSPLHSPDKNNTSYDSCGAVSPTGRGRSLRGPLRGGNNSLFNRKKNSMLNLAAEACEESVSRPGSVHRSGSVGGSMQESSVLYRGPSRPYPVALTVAVLVDSFVDGFLIGLSSSSGVTAGIVMTIALTIEMGFLGLTYSSSMRDQPCPIRILSVTGGPVILLFGAVTGAAGAELLSHYPALHIALISFGIAALLYLVTEELLLEAHESLEETGAGHVWWIDLCFFVGFLLSFLLEKFADGKY